MLQKIRDRAQGWIARIIVALIALTFTLFGAESLLSYFNGSQRDEAASVNGETISRQTLDIEVQRAVRSGRVPPDQQNEARRAILDSLITRTAMEQYARDGGMSFSDQQVDQLLVNRQEFQDSNGHFSAELFQRRLGSAGYTADEFRRQLQEDMLTQQLQNGLIAGTFLLPSETRRLAELRYQQRDFRYATLDEDALEQPVSVSDDEVQAWYDAHKEAYQRPEEVRLEYVVLDRSQLTEDDQSVDEQQLRQRYEQRRATAPREVSDIVVTFGDDRTREEAQARVDEVEARLQDGEDFAALAKQYSDDPSSADRGGRMGAVSEGIFGQPFDEAVSSMSPGEVSQGVESDGVFHVIRVDNIDIDSFDEMRDELASELRQAQRDERFQQLAQQLSDESFSADDLESVADRLNLPLQRTDWVSRNDQFEGDNAVLGEAGVMDAAFSDDVLNNGYNSEPVELGQDRRVVVRVTEHRPATTLALDDVRDQAERSALQEKRRQALAEQADQTVATLRRGETPEGVTWQEVTGATRDGQGELSADLINAAFGMPRPHDGHPGYGHARTGEQQVVFAIDHVDTDVSDEQISSMTDGLWNAQAGQTIGVMTDAIRNHADISQN
ncbi:SurA N-terminal domain-containing protein [Kushneria indalinina]|uniref:Periplasmic chaperone PpiD n=1 Tax=Kushneria indalinina DSM 14324 TaxID=1122140 RepID=A0A3D9DZB0_9GAMM|nr:SurA N-terminal domain-containing protein [Kushneria indalinina]REC96140.1 peptidyl-prolyl cis-trans isomerase D [Kushneria indalinina DSM 14324]